MERLEGMSMAAPPRHSQEEIDAMLERFERPKADVDDDPVRAAYRRSRKARILATGVWLKPFCWVLSAATALVFAAGGAMAAGFDVPIVAVLACAVAVILACAALLLAGWLR